MEGAKGREIGLILVAVGAATKIKRV